MDYMTPTELAWRVYRETFTDGQDVVIEDDQGSFCFGKLKTTNNGVIITRVNGMSKTLLWHEIVFIAESGFPVKEIMGMSYEEAVKRCDELSTKLIREGLLNLTKENSQNNGIPKDTERIRVGGGCPYDIGPCYVENLMFPKNNSPFFWGEDNEEVLILKSEEGATMHSFDLSHIFLWPDISLPGLNFDTLKINPTIKSY